MNAPKAFARSVLCGLFALLACHDQPAAASDEAWALLRKPGHIILLRHSNAPGNVTESNDMNFKDCSIQRNLDAAGRAQAARIGNEFRKRGIGVRLISSQYCRAVETAKLTRLGSVSQNAVLNQMFGSEMSETGSKARASMKRVSSGQLTMLVSHVTNIQAMGGPQLDSGQMAVVHFDKSGEVVVDGTITIP
jgi:phosphohistidine phosphatase SixA